MADDDIKILEPSADGYGNQDEAYKHSTLVMKALKDCMDKRAKEMRSGYKTTKFDRYGNAHPVVIEDTRLTFIEAAETLMMIQQRDYDDELKEKISELKKELKKIREALLEREETYWEEMDEEYKQILSRKGSFYLAGELNEDLPFNEIYIRHKINIYTTIVAEIQKLIKRLGDYGEEIWEA